MHNRYNGELSKRGMVYMQALASERGIKLDMKEQTILVVGLRGSGKSSYCKAQMDDNTLVYDLDAIASAFRLKMPHEEYFKPARKMANDFLRGFLMKAHDYCRKVYVIRTAPTIGELQDIDPDKVVFCLNCYAIREMDDRKAAQERIRDLLKYCETQGIETEKLEKPKATNDSPPIV